jgi:ABC-type uncharacterized transport system substrate-binding protein
VAASIQARVLVKRQRLPRLICYVILVDTSRSVATLQHATRTVPIVFQTIYEPVAQGFVQNRANPGADITGFGWNLVTA